MTTTRRGVPEYAIRECGGQGHRIPSSGQSAKARSPRTSVPTLEEGLKKCEQAPLSCPDPRDPGAQGSLWPQGGVPALFPSYGRLPIWSDDYLIAASAQLRDKGMINGISRWRAPIQRDLERILRLASKAKWIWSPSTARAAALLQPQDDERMVPLRSSWKASLYGILNKLAAEGMELPHVAIRGLCDRGSGVQALASARLHPPWACAGPAWRQP